MKKCLVIDDVEVTRFTSEQIMSSLGFDVVSASTIDEAQAALNGPSVDLILLDWHLRKSSGLDFLRELRAGKHANIKVIMFSGVEGEDKRVEAIKAGADDFLAKPTTKEKVVHALKGLGFAV